ncbi:hypothetical protein [Opitutus sp. ER46]|uniref:hypothetical protein n=1 Tax=Opitutus sp. ER46 TaxID=2161864 RepID=UPI000D3062BE|nr:hypothetical protein [Opitutus sp. ER46]PTX90874.1 hypothetical protein DB354_19680 [Opitutus sp. ER46]
MTMSTSTPLRRIRVCYFDQWTDALEPAGDFLARAVGMDVRRRLANPGDGELLRKARLDCDWYTENARCFAALSHPELEFLPAYVGGAAGLLEFAKLPRQPGEERWLITMGHQPQLLGAMAGRIFGLLSKVGVRHLLYAFDEASRYMPGFGDVAPYLDVLIHDEAPLDFRGAALLRAGCRRIHRSWVANVLPFAAPFQEEPEKKVLFLGSKLGLTDNRLRQFEFLSEHLKDRFVPSHDHSVSVADRLRLNRYKVGLAPEGRKFGTPAMSRTHTDRPFWLGCLGAVPVSENSAAGDRLNELADAGLIVRYPHQDLKGLLRACEQALEVSEADRRRIYLHFNEHETVGAVVAQAIAGFLGVR